MTIGIEGQRLYRNKKHGMDMVALELIKNLQKIDQENQYVIFVKTDEDNSCIPAAPNFKIVELPSKFGYPGWEQVALPRAAEKEGCDILHVTSNTGPLSSNVPLITTLHDIIYMESVSILKKDGTWYQKLGNMYRRYIVPSVIKKSKRVITVSEYEKKRIQDFFKLEENQLVAVYNGVGAHFKKITDTNKLQQIKQQYNLPDKFFFFLGNTDPKKNTKGVLKAFADFNKIYPTQYKIVMLDYDEAVLSKLLQEINASEIRNLIHLTGYVQNTDLPAIISQAKGFLYPSLRESFGIPILEGMACGVPVITSNTASMPEVAGDTGAALIVNPFNSQEITKAMQQIVEDTALVKILSEKGIERAKDFSWKNMAEKVLTIYKEVYQEIQ
ncbi:Glycosyltransferase involved in cell wall bisynthesis [Pustulibacterium marinum]|uniref:Glycosyltransferase involved in cell wall bisynthesis n=1 Tax=Pustulibacterium marinum TaxID=1224947 RepID=A0A1I7GE32_9FLAO|nr:glycosyltransferase family 1 protein [Pustulibacterium marinum]SFU46678.1 Glycosyltransferase involved in cell wall bisynthesis [Pustulibacterium marinum]